ncbi:MAG: hypothetical protein ACE5NG_14715 [bacterium]
MGQIESLLIDIAIFIFGFAAILVYVVMRKKLIILYFVGSGTIMTLATCLYQTRPSLFDANIINYGFPLSWLYESWGGIWGSGGPHYFSITWAGLFLDILFWSTIGFMAVFIISRAKQKWRKGD